MLRSPAPLLPAREVLTPPRGPSGDSELKVSVAKTSRVAHEGKCAPGPWEEWEERRKHFLWTSEALTCGAVLPAISQRPPSLWENGI